MSDKKRFHWEAATVVGKELMKDLEPFVERIEIVGSLRRGRPAVGDVELLFVPKHFPDTSADMFNPPMVDSAEKRINQLVAEGIIAPRMAVTGRVAGWGQQNKLAVHIESGIPVDFFSTKPERWFMSLVIRTGPSEFNIRLIKSALDHGLNLHAYSNYTDIATGREITPTNEKQVLVLAGLQWIEPKDRK